RPKQSLPDPDSPDFALYVRSTRKSDRVLMPPTARRYTLPPSPPSPPSGPPKGTNFSRRKLAAPRPPLPAWTLSDASSTNFIKRDVGGAAPAHKFAFVVPLARAAAGITQNPGRGRGFHERSRASPACAGRSTGRRV